MDLLDIQFSKHLEHLVGSFQTRFPPVEGKTLWTLYPQMYKGRVQKLVWRRMIKVITTKHGQARAMLIWKNGPMDRREYMPIIHAVPGIIAIFKQAETVKNSITHYKNINFRLKYRLKCFLREARRQETRTKLPIDENLLATKILSTLCDVLPLGAQNYLDWMSEIERRARQETEEAQRLLAITKKHRFSVS